MSNYQINQKLSDAKSGNYLIQTLRLEIKEDQNFVLMNIIVKDFIILILLILIKKMVLCVQALVLNQ